MLKCGQHTLQDSNRHYDSNRYSISCSHHVRTYVPQKTNNDRQVRFVRLTTWRWRSVYFPTALVKTRKKVSGGWHTFRSPPTPYRCTASHNKLTVSDFLWNFRRNQHSGNIRKTFVVCRTKLSFWSILSLCPSNHSPPWPRPTTVVPSSPITQQAVHILQLHLWCTAWWVGIYFVEATSSRSARALAVGSRPSYLGCAYLANSRPMIAGLLFEWR